MFSAQAAEENFNKFCSEFNIVEHFKIFKELVDNISEPEEVQRLIKFYNELEQNYIMEGKKFFCLDFVNFLVCGF